MFSSSPSPALAAAPGFHLGDIYAVALLAGGAALLFAVIALSREQDRAFSSAIVYLIMGAVLSVVLQKATTIYWTVIACGGLSILVHGLSGAPVSRRMGLKAP